MTTSKAAAATAAFHSLKAKDLVGKPFDMGALKGSVVVGEPSGLSL